MTSSWKWPVCAPSAKLGPPWWTSSSRSTTARTPRGSRRWSSSTPARTDTPPYTNLIRATLQAISAITGGCDGLTIPTPALPEGDVLARRIVRNIHNLLRDESFLGRVADPIGGSYTVEQLTDVPGRRTWVMELKKAIEVRELDIPLLPYLHLLH
jgi:methylmalonyl-CoA mutase N-terminal domain/subunit